MMTHADGVQTMLVALRGEVKAVAQDYDLALSMHEAWKPAAFDADLHARLGESYASNTFLVIRLALRREMLMALMRCWDNSQKASSLLRIANKLADRQVMDVLAAECEAHWHHQPDGARGERSVSGLEDATEEERATYRAAFLAHEAAFGRQQSDALREAARQAVALIRRYDTGDGAGTLKYLRQLRNQHLAHRQLVPTAPLLEANKAAEAIEGFFQDMTTLVALLRRAVEDTDYRPEESAEIRRRHAELFWGGVRGERTEGHPAYQAPRRLAPEA